MTRKFKSGDRVKTKPNKTWLYFLTCGVGHGGTVVDYDENGYTLVKFDNFTNGHSGDNYYSSKGIIYDLNNHQHLYVREEDLCLLEGE